ncbi:unnamed protein product [Arabidopsis halleri]
MEYSGDVGISSVHACFNTLNSLSGVGILAIPYALSSSGWISILFFLSNWSNNLVHRFTTPPTLPRTRPYGSQLPR